MSRILWVSDSPLVPSAYGQQAALIIPRLRRAGHEVALCAVGNYSGSMYRLGDGTYSFPCISDPYFNDIVYDHATFFQADVVITLCDPHMLNPAVYGCLPWCAWTPVDCDPPRQDTLSALRSATCVWSVSKSTESALSAAKIKSTYVPHGIDLKTFCLGDRKLAREHVSDRVGVDLTSKFLITAVAANASSPSRKGFFEMFSAMRIFSEKCPEAILYIHTDKTGGRRGEDLIEVMRAACLDPERVVFPQQYNLVCGMYQAGHLAITYRAADVFLSTSHGEGFGIPSLEAQASGCPVILPNNTAQSEMLFGGWSVETEPYLPCAGASIWFRPRVEEIVKALQEACEAIVFRNDRAAEISNSVKHFDIDHVFSKYFQPAIAEL